MQTLLAITVLGTLIGICTSAGELTCHVTCDDSVKVFADGTKLATNGAWTTTTTVTIPAGTSELILECTDGGVGQAGIIASCGDDLVTDQSWQCAITGTNDWKKPNIIGPNGNWPWNNRFGNQISSNAEWLWLGPWNTPTDDNRSVTCKKNLLNIPTELSCVPGYLRDTVRPTWVYPYATDGNAYSVGNMEFDGHVKLGEADCKASCMQNPFCYAMTLRGTNECFLSTKTTLDAGMEAELGSGNAYGNTYLYCTKECPSGWTVFEGKCYKVYGERIAKEKDAKAKCESEGAQLIQVETSAENTFFEKILDEAYPPNGDVMDQGTDSWMGGKKPDQNSPYAWYNGQPFTFDNWLPNWDPNEGDDLCTQAYKNNNDEWRWYNADCDGSNGDNSATCEKDALRTRSMYFKKDEYALEKNVLLATLPALDRTFLVSFDVKANSFKNEWQNIIHFTADGLNIKNYGSRVPAVWFFASTSDTSKLHICSAVNTKENYCYNSDNTPIKTGEWTNVQIAQTRSQDGYIFQVYLNGKLMHTVENTAANEYSNVQVYAADNWHAELDGVIRNFFIINKFASEPCLPNPCQNLGSCSDGGSCTCALGFIGDECETIDPCYPNPCQNGGQCDSSDGSCSCKPGYEGTNCEYLACPDGWTKYEDSCYKVFGDIINYYEARERCQEHGADLATAATSEENNAIEKILNEAYTGPAPGGIQGDGTLSSGTDSWLGASRAEKGEKWIWVNGNDVGFTDWLKNWTPDETNHHCLQTYRNNNDEWRWYTADCDDGGDNAYTCEKKSGPECAWRDWMDRDNPGASGDWEVCSEKKHNDGHKCPGNFKGCPFEQIQIRQKGQDAIYTTVEEVLTGTGDVIEIRKDGFVCKNADQSGRSCKDYQVKFCCIPDLFNIARGKDTWQDSMEHGGIADRAVDGNTNAIYGQGSCTHTSYGSSGSPHTFRVDLGAEYVIDHIKIYNRATQDCCSERLNGFKVAFLSNDATDIDRNGDFTASEICYESSGAASAVNTVQCNGAAPKHARYVYVYTLTGEALTLCEVEVFSDGIKQ